MSQYADRRSVLDHGERVTKTAAAIAEHLGVTEPALSQLRVGALLHDIGKVVVPDAILRKPGPLNDAEFAVIKSHTVIGQKILSELGLTDQALWIRHHHERVDGGGYPDGLRGSQIPLESRIIFVADTFDAITSERPYRRTRSPAEALEEIIRHAGSQFDTACTDALTASMQSSL